MSDAITGFLLLIGIIHAVLVLIPLVDTLKANISSRSKLAWCLFLLLVPLVGVALFHFRFRSGIFHGEKFQISADDERSRSGTLAPRDKDLK